MSEIYTDAELSMSFNDGHNDAWNGKEKRPKLPMLSSDQTYGEYLRGYRAGEIARYWYDKGFEAGKVANGD